MTVGRTVPEDLPFLAELEKDCFSRPWSVTALAGTMGGDGAVFFTAKEDGLPVGYVGSFPAGNEREITNIAVSPAYRRRGIAKALLSELIGEARERGEEKILLEVRASNLPARTLYGSLGFVCDGVRRRYYRDPVEDAVLMSLSLKQTEE
ncbi:MAG: ribosomal protein S18-alanine N-acetyltransferase [Lachnospiraceae bacterium]|nr:ribosomal protein S18-alanine N-acetyltransferase [Lachnospiraceae bacterium]